MSEVSGGRAVIIPSSGEDAPQGWRVETVPWRGLASVQGHWEALAESAAEPNVYFEPWMMLPAMEMFHPRADVQVFLVWRCGCDGTERLAGLFPFERNTALGRRTHLRLLRYYFCSLCTPLVDGHDGRACIDALLDELELRPDTTYEIRMVRGDGPVWQWLRDALTEREAWWQRYTRIERAIFLPSSSADHYLEGTFTGERRRDLRRRERRLAEKGLVRYQELHSDQSPERWMEEFLRLESSGWKGRAGSAFLNTPGGKLFFHRVMLGAFRRGRLRMTSLRVGLRAAAMLCLLQAGDGQFAFRTAYAESYAKSSPGLLLCLRHSCDAHHRSDIRWIDSCADPNSRLFNRIWKDRLPLQTVHLTPLP